jgi:lipid-A-disaccharide synthase
VTTIAVCSGEPSGDALVQEIVPALRARFGPEVNLRVLTSAPIEGVADEEILCSAPEAVLGLSGTRQWRSVLETVWKILAADPPDLFVAVAHHGFNLIVAAELEALAGKKTRTLMVAPPEVWAWDVQPWFGALRPLFLWAAPRRQSVPYVLGAMLDRGRSTLEAFDAIACLLEPNVRAYRRRRSELGSDAWVTKVGHPFARYADPSVRKRAREAGRSLRSSLSMASGARLVGLFPGSRQAEVEILLPIMLDAAERLRAVCAERAQPVEFFLAASGERRAAQIRSVFDERASAAGGLSIPVVVSRAEAALAAADFGLLCSGTVTLQAACLGLPSVVAYQRGWSWAKTAVGHLLVRKGRLGPERDSREVPFALPSGVLGEPVFPELAMGRCTPDRLAAAMEELIESGDARERLHEHQERLLTLLQPESPSDGVGTAADTPMQRVAEIGHRLLAKQSDSNRGGGSASG